MEENQEPPEGWPRNPVFNAPGDVPGPPVQFGPPVEPATVTAGEGFTGIGLPENDIFYFHPDHLGSTSYITAKNGSQHVEYIAFGEVLFEEHSSTFSSPYLFNGKELDRETNLSYYGARYLDMKTSLWLSIDPLVEKFPNASPYAYCFNNPLRFTDPTGMAPSDIIVLSMGQGKEITRVKAPGADTYVKVSEAAFNKASSGFSNDNKDYNTMLSIGSLRSQERLYDNADLISEQVGNTISITGSMREGNNKIGDVTVTTQVDFDNGSTKALDSFSAVAGGYGNGAPENGNYTVSNFLDTSPDGWYNRGMNSDGVGFSFNLNPQFSTNRSDLRIHPDGNNEGTLGCIGLSGNATQLSALSTAVQGFLQNKTSTPATINITNNPNNNGRSGTRIPNVNE